jgi:hypothetical protein
MKITLSAYLPILYPIPKFEVQNDYFLSAIEELKNNNVFFTPIGLTEKALIKLDFSNTTKRWKELDKVWRNNSLRKHLFLQFQTEAEIKPIDCNIFEEPISEEELLDISKSLAADDLKKLICDLILTSNIAKPSSIDSRSGFIFVDGELKSELDDYYGCELCLSLELAQKLGWPPINKTSIIKTWEWISRIDSFDNGVPEGPAGRAIAAMSYILNDDSFLRIVWALLGLEALYGKGNIGLREQLLAKSESFLGSRTMNKKKFGNMYDYRSRLLHGDIDIPLEYTPYDGEDRFMSFLGDTAESTQIAEAMLIATLQKMVSKNIYELNFRYTLEN